METRTFELDLNEIRAETRTVPASLSSEYPVQRYDGEEILRHTPESVDLSRAPLPLLTAHDNTKLPVGVVEGLRVEDSKLKGIIRLSGNQTELWNDIKDGILRNLSIGYRIIEKVKTRAGIVATRWQPYECSLVAAPADNTIGINRQFEKKDVKIMDKNDLLKAKKTAVDEMTALAKSGENLTRMDELKTEVLNLDARISALDIGTVSKIDDGFIPEKKETRSLIEVAGGPCRNRSYAGMFNGGSPVAVNEDEIRAFRDQMLSGTDTAGGFSVPEPLAAAWLDTSLESEIIRPRATVWPMESASRKVVGWDASDRTGGELFGGFAMEFISEAGAGTPQTGKLRLIELHAHKGAIFCDISNELREDGQGFEAQLQNAMQLSIGYGLDKYLIGGNGSGQPMGIRNDPAKITVSKETIQPADTIQYDNLVKMYGRMYPAGRSRAVWLCNHTTLPALMRMVFTYGESDTFFPVFQPSASADGLSIFGRPVVLTSHLPVLGDLDDIMFVDLSQYAVGIRRDLRLEKSNIPGWQNDLMSYRVMIRFDGMGTWNDVLTPENGDTLSWCVSLEAR